MSLRVVIPMAGTGSRFCERGYRTPKPFIEFAGRMMIEHVLEGLSIPGAEPILIIRREFETHHRDELDRVAQRYAVSFVTVDRVTQGAACTALAARRRIDDASPVLFADSDNVFDAHDIEAFVNDARTRSLDASLLTVHSDRPSFSYARLDERGLVCETREKQVISSHAIAGAYYFAHGVDFVDAAVDMLIYGDRQHGEYYMSQAFNGLVAKAKSVGIHEIPADRFRCVGTPEQLEACSDA